MTKCNRCPIHVECKNKIKLKAVDDKGVTHDLCLLMWVLGLHLKDLPKPPTEEPPREELKH